MYIVIRAGGYGTRLWPYSRKKQPKQFQVIFGNKTMLQHTYERCLEVVSKDRIYISVNIDHIYFVKQQIPDISDKHIIIEPESKNTGPAICLESLYLAKQISTDETVVSIPSDDFVKPTKAFKKILQKGDEFLKQHDDYIVTPVSVPQMVDTGYSYVKHESSLFSEDTIDIFTTNEWIEKPDEQTCKTLVDSKIHFCHTGMYMWKLKTILSLYEKLQGKMYSICKQILDGDIAMDVYNELEKISVEYAITKHVKNIACIVSKEMIWSDLGKWYNVFQVFKKEGDQNVIDESSEKKKLLLSSKGNVVFVKQKKLITLYDVHDMVIIDTDDVLFICPREKSAYINNVLEVLKEEGFESTL